MFEAKHIKGENLLWGGITLLASLALLGQIVQPDPGLQTTRSEKPILSARPFYAPATDAAPEVTAEPVITRSDLFVEAVIQIESGGRADCVGRRGERGLMQLRAGTWEEITKDLFGVSYDFDRAFEPELNRVVGRAYLEALGAYLDGHRDQWRSDRRSLMLACYNAGPSRVRRLGFDLARLPASTRDYVARARALHDFLAVDGAPGSRVAHLAVRADPLSARLGS